MADGYIGLHTRRAATTTRTYTATAYAVEPARPGDAVALIAGLKEFASGHGGATAAIEYAGRKGAKIVLQGADGTIGLDQFAESTEAAREACARAGVHVEGEWERELSESMRVSSDVWAGRGRRPTLTR